MLPDGLRVHFKTSYQGTGVESAASASQAKKTQQGWHQECAKVNSSGE
jgi:hypothetical protein